MTFEEALIWCSEHGAKWGFEHCHARRGFILWLAVDQQRTELFTDVATDWGWLLIEAVARFADESPTARVQSSAVSGTRARVDAPDNVIPIPRAAG